jgi:PAT family beta-lactamase induction signal transducer AmpG
MREQGASRTAIGYFGLLMLPLVVKFLWAPMVDRVCPIARAHRAGWVLITQVGTIGTILSLLLVDPQNVAAIIAIGLVASLLISTQDIATDGYAAKYLSEEDRAIGNAIQGGAVAFGVVIGGTLGLVLYSRFGWNGMLLSIAALSVLPLVAAFAMRESDLAQERMASPRPSLKAFLRRPEARQVLWIALVYRASEGLVKAMEGPYLLDAGISLETVGYLSGISAATAGLAGSALAAWLIRHTSLSTVLGYLGGLRTLCFLLFALHALGFLVGTWPILGAAGLQTLIRYMEIVALYSLFMTVTSTAQPGTDFTILSCAQILVYLVGSVISGTIADALGDLGYGGVFMISAGLSMIAVLATVRMLMRVQPSLKPA